VKGRINALEKHREHRNDIETTSKRLFKQIGDRLLPARVDFKGIEQVVTVNEPIKEVVLEFAGHRSVCDFSDAESCAQAKYIVVSEVADLLEDDGVIVTGRPQ